MPQTRIFLIAIGLLFSLNVLAANFSPAERQRMISDCVAKHKGNLATCRCMVDGIAARIPDQELKDPSKRAQLKKKLKAIASSCIDKHG